MSDYYVEPALLPRVQRIRAQRDATLLAEERDAIRHEGFEHVVRWTDFLSEPDSGVPSLWGEALLVKGGGYSILSGDSGVGKTILVLNLALALASGSSKLLNVPLIGRPVPVLLFAAEGSRAGLRARLRSVAASRGVTGSLPIFLSKTARPPRISEAAFGAAIEESGAELVVLDPIGRFFDGEENSSRDWRAQVTGPLDAISQRLGIGFLLTDHYAKPAENRSGAHRLRGSAAKVQDCGAAMRLEVGRGGPGSRTLFFDRVRDGALPFEEPAALALSMDTRSAAVVVDGAGLPPVLPVKPQLDDADAEVDASILKALRRAGAIGEGQGLSTIELARSVRLGRNGRPLRSALERLVELRAVIVETGPHAGRYFRLPEVSS